MVWSASTAKEFWKTKLVSYFFVYLILNSLIAKNIIEYFIIFINESTISPGLKLLIRFGLDPICWECFRSAERHFARLNPSPGPCLQIPYCLSFALQQAFFSRYIMFLLAADGTVKSMATVQTILSLHELMISLSTKDRDKYLARAFLGKQSAEAMLMTKKQHDILAMNSIISAFAEISAITVLTLYLYVFRMAKEGNENVVNFSAHLVQATNLIAIEVILSFLVVYVQQKFYGIKHKTMFPKILKNRRIENDADDDMQNEKKKCLSISIQRKVLSILSWRPPYAFYIFTWTAVMLIHKITTYLVSGQFHRYLCPRVNEKDGLIYTFQCSTDNLYLAPGGNMWNVRGFFVQNFDMPVAVNDEKFYRNTS